MVNNSITDFNDGIINYFEDFEKRLTKIEHSINSPYPLDYSEFEDGFRGPELDVKKRQGIYLSYFNNGRSVLDIGCGRGEFLELLRDNKVSGFGIDLDERMVARCLKKGLDAEQANAIDYLNSLPAKKLENVFSSMVVEHLNFNEIYELLKNIWTKMKKDSVLLIETINPNSFYAQIKCFVPDPTHVKLLFPETLRFLCEKIGFRNLKIVYKTRVPGKNRLNMIKINDKKNNKENLLIEAINKNMKILDDIIFGYQEYFLTGKK